MAVRFTILVLLTTVVVVVSSAGLLGEHALSIVSLHFSFLFFSLFFFLYPNRCQGGKETSSDIRGPTVFVRFVTRWNKQSFNVSHINRGPVPLDIPFGDERFFFRT